VSSTSPYLRIRQTPKLKNPAFITAFAGWNDAAEVATSAIQQLVRQWDAPRLAEVDPEEFFVFTEQRPVVHLDEAAQRKIDWPTNELYYRQAPDGGRDCILLVGTEPSLRWRTFVDTVLTYVTDLGANLIVQLGGLLADVPHSRAPKLTGSATDPYYAERLGRVNVRSSRYEGPTGIVGVMGQECRARGISSVSLWGNVPHYIGSTPNPKVTAAMLRRLDALLDLNLDLAELDESTAQFEVQVAEALSRDPEAQAYVRQLEAREEGDEDDEEPELPTTRPDLPSGAEVVRELEEFLKRRGSEDEPKG
jgi:proteasome assembly chaperone (PAC2) family protein